MREAQVARALLAIDAVGFTPYQPVKFKSGMLSPVYVDNRRLISSPQHWHLIIDSFQTLIETNAIPYDMIAGIATGGIPHSAALAYILYAPTVYVRPQSKEHGKQNLIEGGSVTGRQVLLIEDMITTGGSSLGGITTLREAGAQVDDCLAITTYGFAMSQQAFQVARVRLWSLTTFEVILNEGMSAGRFGPAERRMIEDWLDEPHHWAERQGFGDVHS
jgi:orotate phosphoribosyltransferase